MGTSTRCLPSFFVLFLALAACSGEPLNQCQPPREERSSAVCGSSLINYNGVKIWSVGDSITRGVGDGISEVGGCGWRDLLERRFAASGITPVFIGSQTGGVNCATCPSNAVAMAHDGHDGYKCTRIQAEMDGWLAAIGGTFGVMIFEAGTNDLIADQANGTTLAQANFDACLAHSVALRPSARFFVSNLPPSPSLYSAPLGIAFAAHVAAKVATLRGAGIKAYLIDHFNGTTPNGTLATLRRHSGNSGEDFVGDAVLNDGVHPSGPGGAVVPPDLWQGYPKMALITYLTMTWATP